MPKTLCEICNNACVHADNCYLTCINCSNDTHLSCLQDDVQVGLLKGDVFFKFFCKKCSPSKKEVLVREKLPWITIILVAVYNLHEISSGLSNRGYFHWKMHIADFISKNWNILLGSSVRKKKNWLGTIAGTLSHYSPAIFLSGATELKVYGWWKLAQILKPRIILDDYHSTMPLKKSFLKNKMRDTFPAYSEDVSFDETSRSSAESWNHSRPSVCTKNMFSKEYVEPCKTLSNCLFDYDMEEALDEFNIDIECNNANPFNVSQGFSGLLFPPEDVQKKHLYDQELSVSNKKQCSGIPKANRIIEEPGEEISEDYTDDNESGCEESKFQYLPSKSLFTIRTRTTDNLRPWKQQRTVNEEDSVKWELMGEFEETELYFSLRQASSCPDFPPEAARLYRKLDSRRLKRRRNVALFDLDSPFGRHQGTSKDVRLLDRFQRVTPAKGIEEESVSFTVRLMGQSQPVPFISPYTQRMLKPYIRRDTSNTPLWVKLMNELLVKTNKNNPFWKPSEQWPIDYCYVRPHHIAAVNNLCCEYFYPGVDLSECLSYPDFSCVALYKKLVIGFGFMVPDAGTNEAYITFLFTRPTWRKAGIGSFILYHLIQTCMGKDVTLHVSVTNPALMLYQKFGFKVEEFVQDFYDKYLPIESTVCKHALFLRLRR